MIHCSSNEWYAPRVRTRTYEKQDNFVGGCAAGASHARPGRGCAYNFLLF
jgi:hypothetical protein